jgi:hypothetical protein
MILKGHPWMRSRISRAVATLGLAAALLVGTAGLASASPAPTVPAPTAAVASTNHSGQAGYITFTKKSTDAAHPNATFGCSLGYPQVTTNFQTKEVQWSGGISCSISLGLYGTTVLYYWPGGPNYAYGNQINTTASSAVSSGVIYGLSNGSYGLNFNVDITPPAGWTTTVGGGCSYINATQILCTTTTPFTMSSPIG